jgi:hypothetical protein
MNQQRHRAANPKSRRHRQQRLHERIVGRGSVTAIRPENPRLLLCRPQHPSRRQLSQAKQAESHQPEDGQSFAPRPIDPRYSRTCRRDRRLIGSNSNRWLSSRDILRCSLARSRDNMRVINGLNRPRRDTVRQGNGTGHSSPLRQGAPFGQCRRQHRHGQRRDDRQQPDQVSNRGGIADQNQ